MSNDLFSLDRPRYRVNKPIRLIELFGGIGSQAMALRDIGADFERWRLVEFDKYCIASYNAIHGTRFEPMDITKIHAGDLGITDTDNYCYIMTYSFPCQDLSLAGKQRGMGRGTGTRSGLLWEVERLLAECDELPQILLMENVPQVHGKKNMADFRSWLEYLADRGYISFWKDMNAMDYGIAQSRNRCFMVSVLGEYSYEFPEPVPLTTVMADYLDETVDDRYYLSEEQTDRLVSKLIEEGRLYAPYLGEG